MNVDRFSMDVMMVSWIYMNVKTYQNIYFNYVHFIACIFMLLKLKIFKIKSVFLAILKKSPILTSPLSSSCLGRGALPQWSKI